MSDSSHTTEGHGHVKDYVLRVNYEQGAPPVRVLLHGYTPGDAETAHQALETEIEHARAAHAPVVFSASTVEHPDAGEPIEPLRVTGVDLIDADDH